VGTVEQPGVEVILQLAHLEGHRGLGHVQGIRRLGEGQQTRHGVEDL